MSKKNKSNMVKSEAVQTQLNQLEVKNNSDVQNKQGSTNQIQPMQTDEGITQ